MYEQVIDRYRKFQHLKVNRLLKTLKQTIGARQPISDYPVLVHQGIEMKNRCGLSVSQQLKLTGIF